MYDLKKIYRYLGIKESKIKIKVIPEVHYKFLLEIICEFGTFSITTKHGELDYIFVCENKEFHNTDQYKIVFDVIDYLIDTDRLDNEQKDKLFYTVTYMEAFND